MRWLPAYGDRMWSQLHCPAGRRGPRVVETTPAPVISRPQGAPSEGRPCPRPPSTSRSSSASPCSPTPASSPTAAAARSTTRSSPASTSTSSVSPVVVVRARRRRRRRDRRAARRRARLRRRGPSDRARAQPGPGRPGDGPHRPARPSCTSTPRAARRAGRRRRRLAAGARRGRRRTGSGAVAGSAPAVGVVGYTTGGGLSPVGRTYGLAVDHVRSFDVVTGDGVLRTASATENPDLFWALKGGRGTAGIVTAVELDLRAARRALRRAPSSSTGRTPRPCCAPGRPGRPTCRPRPPPRSPSCGCRRCPTSRRRWPAASPSASASPGPARSERGRRGARPGAGGRHARCSTASGRCPSRRSARSTPTRPTRCRSSRTHTLLAALPDEAVEALLALVGPDAECPQIVVEVRQLGGAMPRRGRTPPSPSATPPSAVHTVGLAVPPRARGGAGPRPGPGRGALAPWSTGGLLPNFATARGRRLVPQRLRRGRGRPAARGRRWPTTPRTCSRGAARCGRRRTDRPGRTSPARAGHAAAGAPRGWGACRCARVDSSGCPNDAVAGLQDRLALVRTPRLNREHHRHARTQRSAQRRHRGPRRPRQDHPRGRHAVAVRGLPRQPGHQQPGHGLDGPGAREGHHHPREEHRRAAPRTGRFRT